MRVRQILNNNVALVERDGEEIVVFANGISFKKKAGQPIKDSEIEKIYTLDSKDRREQFNLLLKNTDEKLIGLINRLVEYGEEILTSKPNDYIYLALVDHISFALERAEKQQFISSPLVWDIKKFYPQYFEIGLFGLRLVVEEYGIVFPEDEAVSIALHFVNQETDGETLEEKVHDTKTLRNMLNIIKYHFNIDFDESSLNYSRLVTHLQFFIERLHQGESYQENSSFLYEQVKDLYPEAYEAVQKIAIYVLGKFDQELTQDEYTYLILHVHRVTERKEETK